MKVRKEVNTFLKVIYDGGVSVEFKTTHTLDELKNLMLVAGSGKSVLLDTVSEQDQISDDCSVVNGSKMLFCVCATPNNSKIALLNKDNLVKLQ